MDIGKTDNYKFYEGYEDEPEVEISADNMETLHIWDGFFEDIFGEPTPDCALPAKMDTKELQKMK